MDLYNIGPWYYDFVLKLINACKMCSLSFPYNYVTIQNIPVRV